jgi:nucleoside diphosphate kinase
MAGNLTFAMIKPHAVYNKSWADIMVRIRDAGFSTY